MAIDSKLTCFTRGSTLYFRGTISAGDASVVAIDIMISRVVIGAAGFAMLALGLWSSLAQTWRGHLVAWALTTGVAGVALLIIALMGVLTPIRVISIGQTDGYRATVRYDYATFRSLAKRGLNEDVATYLIRLNDAIDGAVAHTTPSSGRFEPGFLDNPIIRILADVKPAFRDFFLGSLPHCRARYWTVRTCLVRVRWNRAGAGDRRPYCYFEWTCCRDGRGCARVLAHLRPRPRGAHRC
jgi:hypothetical protein